MKPVNNLFIRIFLFSFLLVFCVSISVSEAQTMPAYEYIETIRSMLGSPIAVTTDNLGNIYVAESSNNRVRIYSQSGQYQNTIAGLSAPKCVAVDSVGRIYVGNEGTGEVKVYTSALSLDTSITIGAGSGEFDWPSDIAFDGDGKIYVTDRDDHIVKVFNPDGSSSDTIGSPGTPGQLTQPGEFNKPSSIEIDEAAEEIVILDRALTYDSTNKLTDGARIQKFYMNGDYKSGFSRFGFEDDMLRKPQHIALDSEGRIYVTDSDVAKNEVVVYDGTGNYLGTIFDSSMRPVGIALGLSNRLYITSLTASRMDVYGIEPYTNMSVAPLSLEFDGVRGGANPPLKSVRITNNGSSTLDWEASSGEGWIAISELSGSVAPSAYYDVNIGVILSGLVQGTYTGSVIISGGPGAAEVIDIELTVTDIPLIANPGGPYYSSEGEEIILDGSNSSGMIVSYAWDIGQDGSFEYPASPSPTQSHTFNTAGFYYIRLVVTDDLGATDDETAQAEISEAVPTAAFTGAPTSGDAPLAVSFSNNSTGFEQPLFYVWDFGDGTADPAEIYAENPDHTYTDVGTYTVQLTATDNDGSDDSLIMTNYITVNSPPEYPDIQVSRVLIHEDFSSGIPPEWTASAQWSAANPCGKSIGIPFAEPWAIVDSSCTTTGHEVLTTSFFDTGTCDSVELSFSNQFEGVAGDALVEVSSDSGSNWSGVLSLETNDGLLSPNTKETDISSVAGAAEAQLRFNYADGAGGFWAVDNTSVICRPAQLEFTGAVGSSSSQQTLVVANTGIADLEVYPVTLTGTDSAEFSVQDDNCSNHSLIPGERCSVGVVFSPASEGAKSASVNIPSNDPDTPDAMISLSGTATAADADGDGVPDELDNCMNTPNEDQADADSDGVGDVCDNCSQTVNAGQQDTDSDGYGNACDCDLDNDGFVGPNDYNLFGAAWYSSPGSPSWNADADFDLDGFIGPNDLNKFGLRWYTSAPWY